jgi:pyruvate,water dikinase
MIIGRREAVEAPPATVGAKAATLARLAAHGFPVPEFFVVASQALALHLRQNGIPWPRNAQMPEALKAAERVRRAIVAAPVPEAVSGPLIRAYERLTALGAERRVAVRSSAAEEDSATASFAGQFTSVINVEGPEAVLEALKQCWASCLSEGSMRYRAALGLQLSEAPAFGVLVQTLVDARRAGVLFTVHPLQPDGGVAYLEANFGTGESVVGGLTTPDAVTISRESGEVVAETIATKRRMTSVTQGTPGTVLVDVEEARRREPVLGQVQVRRIWETGIRIEQLLGSPQDIEWACDAHRLWILQARPVTGAGARGS